MSEAILEVSGLTVALGRRAPRTLVDDIGFAIGRGERVALVGESGSGKSLTALALLGLLPHGVAHVRARSLRVLGRHIDPAQDAQMRALRGVAIGMVFQEPMTSLNPVLTIGRQMSEAMIARRGAGAREAQDRAIALLDRVGIDRPELRMQQYPHEFSGGMRQRVMIAMAMMLQPALLIADEPTTALDVTVQARILELLVDVTRENGSGLLLITHDMGVVAQIADRVAVMRRGRIVEEQPTADLFRAPRQAYTRALLAAVPRLDGPGADAPASAGRPVLRLAGVSKRFGSGRRATAAVDDVSLEVHAGETLALVGESGSGKSTLARIAARLTAADSGTVVLDGTDITRLSGSALRTARRPVQMIFQDPYASLDPRFSAARAIAEPLRIAGMLDRSAIGRRVEELLVRVGLGTAAGARLPHQFSGGQRQRIAIARALATGPKLVIADEPTSALDVTIQADILALLSELQREQQLALLFITHDLAVVRRIAHRVAVMRQGRIVEIGSADRVLTAPQHPYTQALLAAAPTGDPTSQRRVAL
ncbi:MAG TPA: ABC transporter ATP-binding protein [Xanthobacteraceae bacterium]|nr:ABC transporter ATP-binding protein [Xanthobacteraceae bacterium]